MSLVSALKMPVVIVLLAVCLKPGAAPQPELCNSIEVPVGDDVTLRSFFHGNLTSRTVDCKTGEGFKRVVHSYRHGKDDPAPQAPQFRNRTALNHEDLTRGAVTVQLFSAQRSDSGKYICQVSKLQAPNCFELNVTQPQQTAAGVHPNTTSSADRVETTKSEANVGVIAGVCVCLGLVLVVVVVLFKRRKGCVWWRNTEVPPVNNATSCEMETLKPCAGADQNHNVSGNDQDTELEE